MWGTGLWPKHSMVPLAVGPRFISSSWPCLLELIPYGGIPAQPRYWGRFFAVASTWYARLRWLPVGCLTLSEEWKGMGEWGSKLVERRNIKKSLAIKELQFKTTFWFTCTTVRMDKINYTSDNSCQWGCVIRGIWLFYWWEYKLI